MGTHQRRVEAIKGSHSIPWLIVVVALFGGAVAARAALAAGSTMAGCKSGSMYSSTGQLLGPTCVTINCTPPPCAAGNVPSGPPGSQGYYTCHCGIGSPDNVCGRDVRWRILPGGSVQLFDEGCSGPCPPGGPPHCEENDPTPIGAGGWEYTCDCK